jgi:methyl coenzyme M reductase subunit C-like uncharacterized protein (methanogenesis marker protein 7)
MKQTAVEWLISEWLKLDSDYYIGNIGRFEYREKRNQKHNEAKEMEKQQKIAYKISTPLGHVAHCIEKYGIKDAIEEYRCKSVNNKESKFWNDCLRIAKFYKTI